MSHSYQHPQPQQRRLILSQCLMNQLREQQHFQHPHESSLSTSSQTLHRKLIPSCLIHSPTTSTTRSRSFFASKLVSSPSSHQHQHYFHEEPTIPCCFNVSSRRWGTSFKLGCSEVSSMDSPVEFSSSLRSPSEIIVSLFHSLPIYHDIKFLILLF